MLTRAALAAACLVALSRGMDVSKASAGLALEKSNSFLQVNSFVLSNLKFQLMIKSKIHIFYASHDAFFSIKISILRFDF